MERDHSTSVRQLSRGQIRSLLAVGLSDPPGNAGSGAAAADEILNADPQLLAAVIRDLRCPCPDSGPFSIYRLSSRESDHGRSLNGASWLDVLTSRKTDAGTLRCLIDAARLLIRPEASEVTRLTGLLIELIATRALRDEQVNLAALLPDRPDAASDPNPG